MINRRNHKRRTEHKLVAYVVYVCISCKVHNQRTHNRVIIKPRHTCQRINIRHQTITEFGIINHRIVSRMTFGSDFPYLTERILSVRTIQRTEYPELIPARIQFTPFLIIDILRFRCIPLLLSGYITILYTEPTNIHGPVRNTTYRIIQSSRNLSLHVFPTGSNITAPCSSRIPLQSGKSGTSQQEHALIVIHSALTIINSFRIHQGIRIEIFGRRS